ncbi:MAG: hypothetical protein EHM42_08525 [Planctomycetaceae bacterium]|nr:MAG: hypothetical protein EHM42_08525 [Planctomycetaceae bacterium]
MAAFASSEPAGVSRRVIDIPHTYGVPKRVLWLRNGHNIFPNQWLCETDGRMMQPTIEGAFLCP